MPRISTAVVVPVAATVADPPALASTDVTSASAPAAAVVYTQADAQAMVTLINEQKADLNALRADVVAVRTTLANLMTSLRSAGLLNQ